MKMCAYFYICLNMEVSIKCPGFINFVVLIDIPWNLDVQKIKA